MTKKLEELFNLEEKKSKSQIEKKESHDQVNSLDASFKEVEKITQTLPEIKELDTLDEVELDNLAKKAEDAYDDLMDLGMNVEVRYAGRIFEVAASMMGNAINAKTAKIDKKLKAVDLQLKKYKIDKDSTTEDTGMINGQGYVITDRNELLKKLSQKE
jgi:hypothetical protein